jgi:hypothetical protein
VSANPLREPVDRGCDGVAECAAQRVWVEYLDGEHSGLDRELEPEPVGYGGHLGEPCVVQAGSDHSAEFVELEFGDCAGWVAAGLDRVDDDRPFVAGEDLDQRHARG